MKIEMFTSHLSKHQMIPLFVASALAVQFKGRWTGTFSDSSGEQVSFSMAIRRGKTPYVGFIKSRPAHPMIPKKIIIIEHEPNKSYSLKIPSSVRPDFIDLKFSQAAQSDSVSASSVSNDGVWDTTVTFSGQQQIEVLMYRKGQGEWYKFVLFMSGHELLQTPLLIIFFTLCAVVSVLMGIWTIRKLRNIPMTKKVD